MPDAITLFIILLTGKDYIPLRLFINVLQGSVGLVISLTYFYFQMPVKYSAKAVNFLRQSIFKSAAFSETSNYSPEEDPMCSGHEIRDTSSLSISMGSNSSQTESDRPSSLWPNTLPTMKEEPRESDEETGCSSSCMSAPRKVETIQMSPVHK